MSMPLVTVRDAQDPSLDFLEGIRDNVTSITEHHPTEDSDMEYLWVITVQGCELQHVANVIAENVHRDRDDPWEYIVQAMYGFVMLWAGL